MTRDPSLYSLPDSFWQSFVRDHWEKTPAKIPNFFERPIINAEDLFAAASTTPGVAESDRFWVSKKEVAKFTCDFKSMPMDRFGPRPADGSLDGFFERAQRDCRGRAFASNMHQLHTADPALWFRAREFTRGLTRALGVIPSQRWEVDMFLGNYRATPFGIHRDNAGIFSFAVVGRRRYCFWPADYFSEDHPDLGAPDLDLIEPHLDNAIIFETQPGDMVYWPSSHWHIVLSDGEPSATAMVNSVFGTDISRLISERVERLLAKRLERNEPATFSFPGDGNLEEGIASAHDLLAGAISQGDLKHELNMLWLRRRTADGFPEVPTKRAASTRPDDQRIEIARPDCLAWLPAPSGKLVVFMHGLSSEAPDSPAIRQILTALSKGETFSLSSWLAGHQDDETAIRELVSNLDRCRAFK